MYIYNVLYFSPINAMYWKSGYQMPNQQVPNFRPAWCGFALYMCRSRYSTTFLTTCPYRALLLVLSWNIHELYDVIYQWYTVYLISVAVSLTAVDYWGGRTSGVNHETHVSRSQHFQHARRCQRSLHLHRFVWFLWPQMHTNTQTAFVNDRCCCTNVGAIIKLT